MFKRIENPKASSAQVKPLRLADLSMHKVLQQVTLIDNPCVFAPS